MKSQLLKLGFNTQHLNAVVRKAAHAVAEQTANDVNGNSFDNQLSFLAHVGVDDQSVIDDLLKQHLRPGMTLVVSDPKHDDSPHMHAFKGAVDEIKQDMVSVRDQEDNFFDISFDEIAEVDWEPQSLDVKEAPTPDDGETYRVMVLSTAHLTLEDRDILTSEACDKDENMVMERDTGFFVKLYNDELIYNLRHGHSESIKDIIASAWNEGYQMIEFDCDADVLEQFPTFEWEEDTLQLG